MTMNIKKELAAKTAQYESRLSETEVYESTSMLRFLHSLAESILPGQKVDVKVIGDEKQMSATDGKTIWINYEADYVRKAATREGRFTSFLGAFFHECAHIRYLDFKEDTFAKQRYSRGMFYRAIPEKTEENQAWYDEFMDVFSSCKWGMVYEYLVKMLLNVLYDGHDEKTLAFSHGGMVEECITRLSEELRMDWRSLPELLNDVEEGRLSRMQAVFTLLLAFIRDENVLYNEESELESDLYHVLERTAQDLLASNCGDKDPYSALNRLLLETYPFIREEFQKMEEKGNDGQKENSGRESDGNNPSEEQPHSSQSEANTPKSLPQPSSEEMNRLIEKLQKVFEKEQRAGEERTAVSSVSQSDSHTPSPKSETAKALAAALGHIEQETAEGMAQDELEQHQLQEIQKNARDTLSATSTHEGIPVSVSRITELPAGAEAAYEEIFGEVAFSSRILKRKMREVIRVSKDGSDRRNLAFGKKINPRDTYRPQGDFFMNRRDPEKIPEMALAVLVDHSGSMSGEKIQMCRKATILLYDFAIGIGVPCHVAGHNTRSQTVNYIVYSDFDSYNNRKDRLRLTTMKAAGCNRDGAAIEIIANRLANRPEQIKLLLVLSDGMPNHRDYRGEAAEEDIRSIVKRVKKKGIETFGLAIDEDKEVIERIYGDGFISIDDLEELPKTLTNLVKKRLMRNL